MLTRFAATPSSMRASARAPWADSGRNRGECRVGERDHLNTLWDSTEGAFRGHLVAEVERL